MDKFQHKYRIASARAPWHDYNDGVYFITICTAHRKHYFGEIQNAEMQFNELGQVAHDNLQQLTSHYPYAEIDVFQIMPNHIHLIVGINEQYGNNDTVERCDNCGNVTRRNDEPNVVGRDDCKDVARRVSTGITGESDKMRNIANKRGLLSVAIGGFKSAITKYANNHKIPFGWQARFHDHIIRDAGEYERIALYIENNPKTWEQDKFYE
jgi:REP element-mobilizing transposase RayT